MAVDYLPELIHICANHFMLGALGIVQAVVQVVQSSEVQFVSINRLLVIGYLFFLERPELSTLLRVYTEYSFV